MKYYLVTSYRDTISAADLESVAKKEKPIYDINAILSLHFIYDSGMVFDDCDYGCFGLDDNGVWWIVHPYNSRLFNDELLKLKKMPDDCIKDGYYRCRWSDNGDFVSNLMNKKWENFIPETKWTKGV